jgi:hypothetical protein
MTANIYRPASVIGMLTAAGHDKTDVLAAIDSLIESGLTIESDGPENLFTREEIDVLRDQLNS